ncbi:DUF1996 domain-containing protein [Streptomyces sp. KK5PA1]|uniref:DUF1996 domain-containing protein n=2 Tax=Actinacidiphila acididurans TaxID=2784346 RepID=A0ABS2TU28_9ACTN|nr:DUF1996 domain-containing protein [Actinacidiphila acididurans]
MRPSGGAAPANGPFAADFTDIQEVAPDSAPPAAQAGAATGTYSEDCGRDEEGHHNADNVVVSPGLAAGAHHTHDYVGNLSTTAFSTDSSLAAAQTTCAGGDRSTYFWPVLRRQDRASPPGDPGSVGPHGNSGALLPPVSVSLEYRGNAVSDVVAMPRFLRMMTGDPAAGTQGLALAHAAWGCAGFPDRHTMLYPRCPDGDRLTRTLDFPGCWNGLDTDSFNHRTHVAFAGPNGSCPPGTFPIPQLHIVVSYDVPPGAPIALDAFPEQHHSPVTDHAGFVDVMTDAQMAAVVNCLNHGRHCTAG